MQNRVEERTEFQERGGYIVEFPARKHVFVYFLLQGNEVVYVGKTLNGLSRPFSHIDKEFDKIYIISCERELLDICEASYIMKYTPKYNKAIEYGNCDQIKRLRDYIRNCFNYKCIFKMLSEILKCSISSDTLSIIHTKKLLDYLNIKIQYYKTREYILASDIEKLKLYLKINCLEEV